MSSAEYIFKTGGEEEKKEVVNKKGVKSWKSRPDHENPHVPWKSSAI